MNRRTGPSQLFLLAALALALLLAMSAWHTAAAVDLPCPPNPDPQTYAPHEITPGLCDAQQQSFSATAVASGQLVPATHIAQAIQFGLDIPTCDGAQFFVCRGLVPCTAPGDPATVVACNQQGCQCRTADGSLHPCGQTSGRSASTTITGSFPDPGDTPYRLVSVTGRLHCAAQQDAARQPAGGGLRIRYYHGRDAANETCTGAPSFAATRDFEWQNATLDFPGDIDWQQLAIPSDGTLTLQVTPPGAPDPPAEDIQLQVKTGTPTTACTAATQIINAGAGGYPETTSFPVHAGGAVAFAVSAPAGDWQGSYTLWAHFVPVNRTDPIAPAFAQLKMWGNEDRYGFLSYTLEVQDQGSGLRELRPVRDVECATCITALDGADCANTPPLPCTATNTAVCNRVPPPICTIVTWQPFIPGTRDPVKISVIRGPAATTVGTWHFGTHIDALDADNNASDYQEYHYLMPKQWLSLR